MILLCCGGRDYRDRIKVFATLDAIHVKTPVTLVIHGAYHGADTLADQWALSRGIPRDPTPADWDQFKGAAGPMRNRKMLAKNPDLVVAFPGDRGTRDMVRIAKAKGTEVREIE